MSTKRMKQIKHNGKSYGKQPNLKIVNKTISSKNPITMIDGKIVFNNTKNLKWDTKGCDFKKNHITFSVVGDSEEMKSQSVIYNNGGVNPSVITNHLLYPTNWKDEYPNKSNNGGFQFHIHMDEIESSDDIFRLTKTGKYSHLHKWNEDGDVHHLIPIIWTYEKKSLFGWGDFSHSMECVYMMEMFGDVNHIETMRKTSHPLINSTIQL